MTIIAECDSKINIVVKLSPKDFSRGEFVTASNGVKEWRQMIKAGENKSWLE
jgi:hypothetical protein